MRILVLRGGALGDLLVTLPALALLRQRWPESRIELIGNVTAAVLALTTGLLDAIHSQHEARWGGLYGSQPLPRALAGWLEEFDLVISYWPDPEGELQRRFPTRPGQTALFGAAMPTEAPAAAHYCAPLRQLGLLPTTLLYPLRTPVPQSMLVALHPGSGSTNKNWPADRWLALARWLEDEVHIRLLAVTGEAEPAGMLAGVGQPARNLPLDQLADHLAGCRLFLGHDSGVSHLAASAGAPCILLFGPTDPAMWAPPGTNVRVLRRGADLSSISVPDVQQAVRAVLRDQR